MFSERLKPPSPAKYFFAITSTEPSFHLEAERQISGRFGELDVRSEIIDFSDFSTYYDQELGGKCWKYLVSLSELLPVDQIVPVKLFTEQIEGALVRQDVDPRRRGVNIDPGYLTGWQVVLASVKIHCHRLYVGDGVYCELTFLYQNKDFHPFPWTYHDYRSRTFLEFFRRVRDRYSNQI